MIILPTGRPQPLDKISDGSDETFAAKVIEASKAHPVIVDFWAPWCEPCAELAPPLESAVRYAPSGVKLVKIDIEQHPEYAGRLHVSTIPAVFAFRGGRAVDAFAGIIPANRIQAFVAELNGAPPGDDLTASLLATGAAALDEGDTDAAGRAYAMVLFNEPDNLTAAAGMARRHIGDGMIAKAEEILASIPDGVDDPEVAGARAVLQIANGVPDDLAPLKAVLEASPDETEAHIAYARGLLSHQRLEEAAEQLVGLVEAQDTPDAAALAALEDIFQVAGQASNLTTSARRRLSAAGVS